MVVFYGISGFAGFPCGDASLRNEGCFFPVPACRSLLRSKPTPERNRGRSPCITAMVFLVFVWIWALESPQWLFWFLSEYEPLHHSNCFSGFIWALASPQGLFWFLSEREYALSVNRWRSLCALCGLARGKTPSQPNEDVGLSPSSNRENWNISTRGKEQYFM